MNTLEEISKEEIKNLWESYKETNDEETKNYLLVHYSYLVRWIVKRFLGENKDLELYDNLVSCGMLGLVNALQDYEASCEIKFEVFALPRIKAELKKELENKDF